MPEGFGAGPEAEVRSRLWERAAAPAGLQRESHEGRRYKRPQSRGSGAGCAAQPGRGSRGLSCERPRPRAAVNRGEQGRAAEERLVTSEQILPAVLFQEEGREECLYFTACNQCFAVWASESAFSDVTLLKCLNSSLLALHFYILMGVKSTEWSIIAVCCCRGSRQRCGISAHRPTVLTATGDRTGQHPRPAGAELPRARTGPPRHSRRVPAPRPQGSA